MPMTATPSQLTCSHCGKSQHDISNLAGGAAVFVREFVCDECISAELARPTAFSQNLSQSLWRAVALAERRSHEGAAPKHLLLALTDDPDAAPVMQACNVDLEKLRGAILASMSAPDGRPLPDGTVPRISESFQADLRRAALHAQSIGREEINGMDVLVAMLAGPAVDFLHEQGMTRYDATTFISHGITKDAQARPHRAGDIVDRSPRALSGDATGSPMFKVRLLNDDYTPMEFVVYVLEEVFDQEHEDAVRIMLQTHHEGVSACGTFPRKEAEARAAQVSDLARQHQHPLRCCLFEQSGSS
ncbi:MAG TPA: ATP-dependent Clp protease adaptor ClpS [Xanthobacteraceae bacterium]|jgi:ATP-dependent Clp protease adapter protein ClpS